MRYPMGCHQSNESRIVDLNPLHGGGHYESSPQRIGTGRVTQDWRQSLKDPHLPVCFLDRETVPSSS